MLGRVPYRRALEIQDRLVAAREADACPDTLLLLEHPPTVTLGRRAGPADLVWAEAELARRDIAVERVGRGGAATYHGPGQLVGYPIVRIGRAGRAVRGYVGALERILLAAAAAFGVEGRLRPGRPGVWVGDAKIASIGIEVRRGVSRHGFALNVDMDLEPFAGIVPCGMPGLSPTDLSRARGSRVTVAEAAAAVVSAWNERIGRIQEEERDELESSR